MIYYKTKEEIRIIRAGGRRLAVILERLLQELKPGTTTAQLENLALELIKQAGGRPAFKGYSLGKGLVFPTALCISINDQVVHGSALPDRLINSGDVVDIDIGMEWPVTAELRREFQAPRNSHSSTGGFFTDMCATAGVGKVSPAARRLIKVTQECLDLAIKQVKPGRRINDLARAVENHATKYGYGIVRDLVGHGVGYEPHEDPSVFNFTIADNAKENIELKPGMVIAIEPMINLGGGAVKTADDGFTVLTADGSLSAHFEHTVAVTEQGGEVLTSLED
jgi:methionyl aminopeptidase